MKPIAFSLCWLITAISMAEAAEPVRVMSFNIRYGLAKDGDNEWSKRTELVVDTIKAFEPDLLGTQETLGFQAEFLRKQLPEFGYIGQTRDNNPNGEQCAIFYRKERFERIAHDQFWLSESPETKASKSWDSSLPRVATLVVLKDKTSNRELTFYNTHFDHRGGTARLESAKLIRRKVDTRAKKTAIIITGDFNCGEGSGPYNQLLESARLSDSYRNLIPEKKAGEGTFNGFKGKTDGPRIDWVLHSPEFKTTQASIDRFNKQGRYPSDHFPVTAVLNWTK